MAGALTGGRVKLHEPFPFDPPCQYANVPKLLRATSMRAIARAPCSTSHAKPARMPVAVSSAALRDEWAGPATRRRVGLCDALWQRAPAGSDPHHRDETGALKNAPDGSIRYARSATSRGCVPPPIWTTHHRRFLPPGCQRQYRPCTASAIGRAILKAPLRRTSHLPATMIAHPTPARQLRPTCGTARLARFHPMSGRPRHRVPRLPPAAPSAGVSRDWVMAAAIFVAGAQSAGGEPDPAHPIRTTAMRSPSTPSPDRHTPGRTRPRAGLRRPAGLQAAPSPDLAIDLPDRETPALWRDAQGRPHGASKAPLAGRSPRTIPSPTPCEPHPKTG